jgi:hypothetical protein
MPSILPVSAQNMLLSFGSLGAIHENQSANPWQRRWIFRRIFRQDRPGHPSRAAAGLAQDPAGDRQRGRPVAHQLLDAHQETGGHGRHQALHSRRGRRQAGLPRLGDRAGHAGEPHRRTLYDFGRTLATIPEIQEAYLVSGDYDYYIRIAVRDTRDYERLLREKLYKIPGIRHSKSHFVLRVLKETSVPVT